MQAPHIMEKTKENQRPVRVIASGSGITEAYVLHRETGPGSWEALSVVLEPQGLGIAAAWWLPQLDDLSLAELIAIVGEATDRFATESP